MGIAERSHLAILLIIGGGNQLLQAALAKGEITPELRSALEDKTVKIAHIYEEVSFITIAALMVLKPF